VPFSFYYKPYTGLIVKKSCHLVHWKWKKKGKSTHLDVDAIELVEAAPGAGLRQAAEELAEHPVVEALGAVEDEAELAHRLGQVLDRLRLAGARGACGRAAQIQPQRARQRQVAAVGEGRDDEARWAAQVLEAVVEGRVGLHDGHETVRLVVTVPQVATPLEIVCLWEWIENY